MAEMLVIDGAPIRPGYIVRLRPGEVDKALAAATMDGTQNTFFTAGTDTFVASSRYDGVSGPRAGTELR